jgi:glycosyltransferase involved in cell wall biosynthesis
MSSLHILYVAYPLLTVSQEAAGGAEQVLWTLEREMARRGLRTSVAASAGSRVSGELIPTGEPCTQPDDYDRRNREHQERIVALARRRAREGRGFDLAHDMSGSFWTRAAEVDLPILATLHLPRSFYPAQSFCEVAENVSFNCVSSSQARSFAGLNALLGDVSNGIAVERFEDRFEDSFDDSLESNFEGSFEGNLEARPEDNLPENGLPENGMKARVERESGGNAEPSRHGLLWLGRICEEKAPHLALEIAARAGLPITLGGRVYPFYYHQQYFEKEVAPRLHEMPGAVFLPAPSFAIKRRLLRQAQALLVTSQVEETSSLVAMEAAASGMPVIAFRRGALPEVVRDQVTGFVVESVAEAVTACLRAGAIHGAACLAYARENFSSLKMADGYQHLYARILHAGTKRPPAGAKRAATPTECSRPDL